MLLDAAYLPASPGLEPSLVLFAPRDMSPGAWRRAEAALDVPESARRLTIPVGDPEAPRFTQTRALTIGESVQFLIGLGNREVRPSVRAWQIAAHVAQRLHEHVMLPRGAEETDRKLAAFAAGLPLAARSVLIEQVETDDELLGAHTPGADSAGYTLLTPAEAVNGYLDNAQVALALGVAQRAAPPPKRGAARTLARMTVRLRMPSRPDAPWLVQAFVADDATPEQADAALDETIARFAPLARASRVPAAAGRAAHTDPVELSVEEASALIGCTPELHALGAEVELPEQLMAGIGEHVDARVRLGGRRTGAAHVGPSRFRLDDLVTYDLEVALGGTQVDAAHLRKLAREAGSLVRLGDGGWVALTDATRDQLEQLARAVESRDAHMANSKALAAALAGSAQLPGGITARVDRVDDALLGRALDFLRNPEAFPTVEATPQFGGELRPYQQRGLSWLAGMAALPLGACLADDMGLGKTIQVIALLQHLRDNAVAAQREDATGEAMSVGAASGTSSEAEAGAGAGGSVGSATALEAAIVADRPDGPPLRSIVICPTSLIGNWERELGRFAPDMSTYVHHGPQRSVRAADLSHADIVITSYGLVARDRELLGKIGWDIAIFDEAQAVKNADTEQARAVRALPVGMRIALTGTPMENRLLELWSILDLLNPGLLGTAGAFNRRFAMPIERSADETAAATLRAITRPFLLRRVKHDPEIVPDLPDKQEHAVLCTLTPEQAALYQAAAEQALSDVRSRDGIARRGAVLALLTRLKQICNHPAQALGQRGPIEGRSGKLERLESMLEEVTAEGDRALVFTQYAQMGSLLAEHLPERLGCDVLYLHGGVPRPQRESMIARFQAESDEPAVFVLSLKAGGLGLNLMRAAHVFHYDRWWNPAVEDQATDRTHRIGQTRQIQVHKLVCAGTLEERIATIIEDKRSLAGRVIETTGGSGEGWLTELGDEELEALISLSGTAVEEIVP